MTTIISDEKILVEVHRENDANDDDDDDDDDVGESESWNSGITNSATTTGQSKTKSENPDYPGK